MTLNKNWILPQGFQEILPPHSHKLERCRAVITQTFARHGYDIVHPPMLEFLDSLISDNDQYLNLSTFKVTDQQSGRTLGVRADLTPQIARIKSHYMSHEPVSRLSYIGQILLTGRNNGNVNREQMQFGAELFGSDATYADFEVIQLALDCLASLKVNDFTLTIGHMGIIRELVASMNLDAEQTASFYDILKRRSVPDAHLFLSNPSIDSAWLAFWPAFLSLIGNDAEILDALSALCEKNNIDLPKKFNDFSLTLQLLNKRYKDLTIQVDMALMHNYDYHTGLTFYVYQPQVNAPLIKGGRYDGSSNTLGKAIPAIGFSADLYQLLPIVNLSAQQDNLVVKATPPSDILCESFISFQEKVATLRSEDYQVVVQLSEQQSLNSSNNVNGAERSTYTHTLTWQNEQWQLTVIK